VHARSAFALTPAEYEALLLCLAVEIDGRIARLVAYLNDHASRPRPTLALAQALAAAAGMAFDLAGITQRPWLADGKQIVVARAPTWFGPLTMTVTSRAAEGYIVAEIAVPHRRPPKTLLVRFRHPDGKPMRSVAVNGEDWREFEPANQWVRITNPKTDRYTIKVEY